MILLGEEAKCSVPVFASFRVIAVWRFLFIEKGMVLEEGTTRSNTFLTVPCCQHHFPVAIFLDRLLPFSYIQLIPKQVLIIHQIVINTIDEEELIINNLLHPPKEILSPGQKVSDKVARLGGSWEFIILFALFLPVG